MKPLARRFASVFVHFEEPTPEQIAREKRGTARFFVATILVANSLLFFQMTFFWRYTLSMMFTVVGFRGLGEAYGRKVAWLAFAGAIVSLLITALIYRALRH